MKIKFCTDKEQSLRFLKLGADPETADFCLLDGYTPYPMQKGKKSFTKDIPAWSLSALLKLIPPINENTYSLIGTLNGGAMISFEEVTSVAYQESTPIDAVFEMVCWLKEKGYITMEKKEILDAIKDFNHNSKLKSKDAEKRLIELCEPIVKRYWKIALDYGITHLIYNWNNEYLGIRGELDGVIKCTSKRIEFNYSDDYLGEHINETIVMPLEWIDDDFEEDYRQQCKWIALHEVRKLIKQNQGNIDELKKREKYIKSL